MFKRGETPGKSELNRTEFVLAETIPGITF